MVIRADLGGEIVCVGEIQKEGGRPKAEALPSRRSGTRIEDQIHLSFLLDS